MATTASGPYSIPGSAPNSTPAVSINKYGMAVDNNGQTIGIARQADGETQDHYLARAQSQLTNPNGAPIAPISNWNAGGNWASPSATSTTPIAPLAQQTPQATDNSGLISQMYGQQLSAAQDALKKSIQQSMGQYQGTISQAPQQYQPLRDQASAAGYQNLNSLRELLANNGQQGGVNRTETTAVNSATENNINKLNLQQQNVIDTANKSIADLQAQGDIQGAQLVAQNASDKIKALIDESNRVSSTNYQYSQDALKNSMNEAQLTGNYNGQQTLSAKNSALQNALAEAGVTGNYNGAPTLAASNAADNRALQVGQMMGTYNGQDTLAAKDAQQQQAVSLGQLLGYYNGTPTLGRDTLNADTSYKNAALAADTAYKNAALAASRAKASYSASKPTATQQKQNATAEAYNTVNSWISAGYTYAQVKAAIDQHAGDFAQAGVDPNKLASDAYGMLEAENFNNGGHASM